MDAKYYKIHQIVTSHENGNYEQMTQQIDQYREYYFWSDLWLYAIDENLPYSDFAAIVRLYHQLKHK